MRERESGFDTALWVLLVCFVDGDRERVRENSLYETLPRAADWIGSIEIPFGLPDHTPSFPFPHLSFLTARWKN